MFLDSRFRDDVLHDEAERTGVDKAELKRLFFRWIRMGGDDAALIPRGGASDPPGTPRVSSETGVRVGPMDAKELESWTPRTRKGMTARWRTCVETLINSIVDAPKLYENGAIDVDATVALLRSRGKFWTTFRNRFYVGPASFSEINNRPTEFMVAYHRKRILKAREGEIRAKLHAINAAAHGTAKMKIPGGRARDRNADIIETIEMDATEFRKIIVVGRSKNGVRKRLGYATVIVACSRSTGAIVGFYVMIGRETTQAYRKCLYWALADKKTLLEAVGLDPKKMHGIVSGLYGEVLVDRGPGCTEFMQVYVTGAAFMDIAVTRPYVAVDKGTVEGVHKPLKAAVNERAGVKKKIASSAQLEDALLETYAALPRGFVTMKQLVGRERRATAEEKAKEKERSTRNAVAVKHKHGEVELEMRSLVRIVANAVNDLNLKRRTDELALTRDMNLEEVAPTRAEIHRARQSELVGDAAEPVDLDRLAAQILKFEPRTLIEGEVWDDRMRFGAGAEGTKDERKNARLLLEDAKSWAESYPGKDFVVELALVPSPFRLQAKWKRVYNGADGELRVDYLDLPPTQATLRSYGENAGLEEANGLKRRRRKSDRADQQSSVMTVVDGAEGAEVDDSAQDTDLEFDEELSASKKSTNSRGIGGQKFDLQEYLARFRKSPR